jgi:chaperonin cofactor prefoldin|tara:strand:+ start:487 stop:768 length:282 start_codon:yes stop_codon:yes gene_type:complete
VNQELKNEIGWIENAIEEREAMLKKLQTAAKEHHEASDMGWWLTLAGAQGGTAVAVTEGEEARQLKEAANTLEKQITLLEMERRVLQAKVDSE